MSKTNIEAVGLLQRARLMRSLPDSQAVHLTDEALLKETQQALADIHSGLISKDSGFNYREVSYELNDTEDVLPNDYEETNLALTEIISSLETGDSNLSYNAVFTEPEYSDDFIDENDSKLESASELPYNFLSLIEEIEQLKIGLEFTFHLYSVFSEVFQFSRAALLLYDENLDIFAPWAISGFDKTTSSRLRVDFDVLQSIIDCTSQDPVVLNIADMAPLQHCFSLKEFSNLEKLLFLPFIYEGDFLALFIIEEINITSNFNNTTKQSLLNISHLVAPMIYESRYINFNKLVDALPELSDSIIDALKEILPDKNKLLKKLTLIVIEVEAILDMLVLSYDTTDLFRMKQDLYKIFSNMMTEQDKFILDAEGHMILVFNRESVVRPELVLNQIGLTLNSLFNTSFELANLNASVAVYPDDFTSAEDFFTKYVQNR